MRVLATDHFCWSGDDRGKEAAFDLAREPTGLVVDDDDIDPMKVDSAKIGKYDVALFLGASNHLKRAFYCGMELNQDDSHRFSPIVPTVIGMLKTVGFRRSEHVLRPESTARAIFYAWK